MSKIDFNPDEFGFVSIPDLLHSGVKVPQLADAIETVGVQGWDRYGRFKAFTPKDKEGEVALDFLAMQYEWETHDQCGQTQTQSPLERVDWDSAVYMLGWRRQTLPDFAQLAAQRSSDPTGPYKKRSSDTKRENADLALVGALLSAILGEDECFVKHPQFTSQADLIGYLVDRYGSLNGISKRSMEEKFSLARQMIRTID